MTPALEAVLRSHCGIPASLGTPVLESRALTPRAVVIAPDAVLVGSLMQFRFQLDVYFDLQAIVRAAELRLFGSVNQ